MDMNYQPNYQPNINIFINQKLRSYFIYVMVYNESNIKYCEIEFEYELNDIIMI